MNDTPLTPTETEATSETAAPDDDFPEINTPEWDAMNRRRAELIRKKNREGLTPDELVEFERLQRLSLAAIQRAFPPSPLLDRRRLAELAAQFLPSEKEPAE